MGGVVDLDYCVVEGKTPEIDIEGENPIITFAKVDQGAGSRIRDREIVKGAEETRCGNYRELLQIRHNHHLAIIESDCPDKDVEAIHDEGGVKAGKLRSRHEVIQG